MQDIELHIRSWSGWTEDMPPFNGQTPPSLHRRITPMGRIALALAWQLPDGASARYILSSRHGEFDRTLSLLKSTIKGEELSPADFTLSVHHALIGLLSIAKNNKNGHTAIAAGADSFCLSLIEAAACIAENPHQPVILIHCDDNLPLPFDAFSEACDCPVALALLLTSPSKDTMTVTQSWLNKAAPQIDNHATQFLRFLSENKNSHQSQGPNHLWQWKRHEES